MHATHAFYTEPLHIVSHTMAAVACVLYGHGNSEHGWGGRRPPAADMSGRAPPRDTTARQGPVGLRPEGGYQ